MTVLALLLALVALVLFVLASFDRGTATGGRTIAYLPLGLAFLTAALICQFTAFGGGPVTA